MGKNIKTKAHLSRVDRIEDLERLVGKLVYYDGLKSGKALYAGIRQEEHIFITRDEEDIVIDSVSVEGIRCLNGTVRIDAKNPSFSTDSKYKDQSARDDYIYDLLDEELKRAGYSDV